MAYPPSERQLQRMTDQFKRIDRGTLRKARVGPSAPPITSFRLLKYDVQPFRGDRYDLDDQIPCQRSGHRVLVDDNFLYVVGGFRRINDEGVILREIWRMHLLTNEWTRLPFLRYTSDYAPLAVSWASAGFAHHGEGTFTMYGGTNYPFGEDLSDLVYIGTIVGKQIKFEPLPSGGFKPDTYGHIFMFDRKRDRYISIGGTDRINFNMDVHFLEPSENDEIFEYNWREVQIADPVPDGMYKMEGIIYRDNLLIFGGGNSESLMGFEELLAFDLVNEVYKKVPTLADEVHGYPRARKCIGLAQHGKNVVMTGGCVQHEQNHAEIAKDTWILDLKTMAWRRGADLAVPVFFHDAAFTRDGRLLVFGGIVDEQSERRTNIVQTCRIEPPTLYDAALEVIAKHSKVNITHLDCGNRQLFAKELATLLCPTPRPVAHPVRKLPRGMARPTGWSAGGPSPFPSGGRARIVAPMPAPDTSDIYMSPEAARIAATDTPFAMEVDDPRPIAVSPLVDTCYEMQ